MQKYLLIIIVGLGLSASVVYFALAKPVAAAQSVQSNAIFDSHRQVEFARPTYVSPVVVVGSPNPQYSGQRKGELSRISSRLH